MLKGKPAGLLFVCLGNICRSPMAEAIFADLAEQRGVRDRFVLDSCGIGGWHAGDGADRRAVAALVRQGVPIDHEARQVRPAVDFQAFDLLLAMDMQNQLDLLGLGAPAGKVRLLRSFDPSAAKGRTGSLEVPDPYTEGDEAFDAVYRMLVPACAGLLAHVLDEGNASCVAGSH